MRTDHHYFLSCWNDAVVWYCIFNQRLEDPADGALQPPCPCPGILLLVSITYIDMFMLFVKKHCREVIVTSLVLNVQVSSRVSSLAHDLWKEG